jgi:hypothetical protein
MACCQRRADSQRNFCIEVVSGNTGYGLNWGTALKKFVAAKAALGRQQRMPMAAGI